MSDDARARIPALWDELADFDAARPEDALNCLLQGLCTLTDAWNATWIGAVRMGEAAVNDPVKGWRARSVGHLHPRPSLVSSAAEQVRNLEAGFVDASTIRNVSLAGQFRVHLLSDLVPASWFDGHYYRLYYAALNHQDAIWAGVPINEDAEMYFGLYRGVEQPRFTTVDRDMVAHALRPLRWFLRQQMLGHGLLVASSPLTPVERLVLRGLLAGLPERKIAEIQGQSYNTTHEYVSKIFRKYSVNNRPALMALWLGQNIPPN